MSGNVAFYPGGGIVGVYQMEGEPSVEFGTRARPSLFHRVMVRAFLGWKWVERIEPGSGVVVPTINGAPFPNAPPADEDSIVEVIEAFYGNRKPMRILP